MRLTFLAAALLLAACRHDPAPGAQAGPPAPPSGNVDIEPPPAADAAPPPPPPPSAAPAPAPVVRHHYELRRDELVNGFYWKCSVVDTTTRKVVGHATGRDVAAGGSVVECTDFAAEGQVIVFTNSRVSVGKDARFGKTNDQALPCHYAIYADDASSCVDIDSTPFLFGNEEPFDIRLSDLKGKKATTLISIPHGLERKVGPEGIQTRWWDARYCENDRLLVVAENELRLYEAPSGKQVGKVPAPKQTRITDCHEGTAETTNDAGTKRTWIIRRDYIGAPPGQ